MGQIAGKPLDRCDVFPFRARHRGHARTDRLSLQMHSTGPAERHAAAKFCSCQSERVSEDPQQRSRWINVHLGGLPIYKEIGHVISPVRMAILVFLWMAEANRRLRQNIGYLLPNF